MIEIWIVVQRQRQTHGHGDYGDIWKLPTMYDSGPPHPAFTTKQAAEDYIATYAIGLQPLRVVLRADLATMIERVVGEVGIFGALALIHDRFDRNPSQYETYPVIQSELRRFDRELRVAVDAVDPVIDREISEELAEERRQTHGVTELIDRP